MAMTNIILLRRVAKLGNIGDVVTVAPGYAKNFLLPQKMALRANKANLDYFASQKVVIEAENLKRKDEALKIAEKMKDLFVCIVRQSSENGSLYGSVTSKSVSDALKAKGFLIKSSAIELEIAIKQAGVFNVSAVLHPDVRVNVLVSVAKSEEEAETQFKQRDA